MDEGMQTIVRQSLLPDAFPAISTHATGSRVLRDAALLVLFAGIAIAAYYPALNRVFASDQVDYMAELHGTSLADGLHFYDYSRTRRFEKGDEALFRPLLFVLLAVENTLFSYNYVMWNIVNLCLHVITVFLLYKLLESISRSWFAVLCAVLFAVLLAQCELPMWNHLGGYILGWVCFLVTLIAARRVPTLAPGARSGWLSTYGVFATLAAFTHELVGLMGVFSALYLIATCGGRDGKYSRQVILCAAAPLFLYTLAYVVRLPSSGLGTFAHHATHSAPSSATGYVLKVAYTLLLWSRNALLPWSIDYRIQPYFRFTRIQATDANLFSLGVVGLLLAAIGFVCGLARYHLAAQGPFALMLLCQIGTYAAVICLGRGAHAILHLTSYYEYGFCLLMLILLYCAFDVRRAAWWPARSALVAGMAITILLNFLLTARVARKVAIANASVDQLHSSIRAFIRQHKTEAGFSFDLVSVIGDLNPRISFTEEFPDGRTEESLKRAVPIIYGNLYKAESARYHLQYRGNLLSAYTQTNARSQTTATF